MIPAPTIETAFAEHYGFVRARLRGLGVAPADLDDAAQDVFEVLVRRIADYDPRQPLRGWMAGIARRVGRRYRERGHRAVVPLDERRLASGGSPEDRAARAEAWQVLQTFADQLDPARWSVFVLAEIEGLRGTEIAAELDLNLNTVYARLRSARTAFERTLRRHHLKDGAQRRGLLAVVPIWPASWRGWSWPGWMTGLAGSATLSAAALLTFAGGSCGGEKPPASETRSQAEQRPVDVSPRPHDPANAAPPAFAEREAAPDREGWIAAGSSYLESTNSAGKRYVLSIDTHFRFEGDRVIYQRTYIGDDDLALELSVDPITGDGLTVIDSPSPPTIAIPAGETRAVTVTLQASRGGVVGFDLGSGTTQHRFVHERGALRGCELDECQAPTGSEEPHLSGTTITLDLVNECEVTREFVVFAGYPEVRPSASTPVHSLEPDQRRSMEIDAAQWLLLRHPDGRIGGGAQVDSDGGRVRFFAIDGACTAIEATDPGFG